MSGIDADSIPIRRSYERDVVQPLKKWNGGLVTEFNNVTYGSHVYPLLAMEYLNVFVPKNSTVLISGGVHGDEPAGVYAVLDFLREEADQYTDRMNMIVLPCINPSGFEANKRKTMNGKDLNRLFGTGSDQPEIRSAEEYLARLQMRFRITLDCHEDGPTDEMAEEGVTGADVPPGCYVYENMVDTKRRIGRALIHALPPSVEVCTAPIVYGDTNDQGVIAYPEANGNPFYAKGTSFDAYLLDHWTDHSLTMETSMLWSMEKRIEVHRTWIRTALDLILRERVQ
ncbi:M14 family metallocarboxypeptidase [Candidatus Peregrinibacteria bacterium]|nr:M14 family metallocarboxypeptidase [Candidatus Peregrinibacteria bacterium]